MIHTCERCGKQTAKLWQCDYCGRWICVHCIKSMKKKGPRKIVICKDCWTNMQTRKQFKTL